MTDSWQIVRQKPERRWKQPRLYFSLNRRGEISMNAKAYAAILQPGTVTLLYDPKTNRIGVKSPVALDRHFFRVRRTGRGRKTLIVNAARLLKQFAITVDATRVFRNVQCVRFEGQPMLLMSLDEAVPPSPMSEPGAIATGFLAGPTQTIHVSTGSGSD